MQEQYKYFAFISFQSADAKEALWVQKAIEGYRLPTAVSRTHSLPKKMRPCFCYLNDINLSEELMQELKQRMEQSEYLIVVCSPRSAKSTFVNGGIDYFVSLGRRDRIIPLIVDGVPYTNDPETECYPEALRRHFPKNSDPMQDHQILGVNINEEGAGSRQWKRRRAVMMVIARMLGLEFENLWNREVQRRRRKRNTIIALVALVLALLGLTWYYSRSIDVNIRMQDVSAQNKALPQSHDACVNLILNNEQKTIEDLTVGDHVVFPNIPQRFIGKKVRIVCAASNYFSVDTMLTLRPDIVLPISRDPQVFGDVRFGLRGADAAGAKVEIAGLNTFADENGQVDMFVPLEQQQTAYAVVVNGKQLADRLFMPCGENDVMIIDN